MAETFDQQLARLREIAALGVDVDGLGFQEDADALCELLRRWDALQREWADEALYPSDARRENIARLLTHPDRMIG